jgi:hypothetical protein
MLQPLSRQVAEQIEKARHVYHRLVIVAGPSRSGKTSALRDLQEKHGWPLVNINLALSEKLLELTAKQRALRLARIVGDLVQDQASDTVLLDNIELLFDPGLKQDPLRLLQSLSRNQTIVATWRGAQHGSSLTYGAPDHPEFRRYEDHQSIIVSSGASFEGRSAREHSP